MLSGTRRVTPKAAVCGRSGTACSAVRSWSSISTGRRPVARCTRALISATNAEHAVSTLGEGGVLRQQVRLGGHDVGLGELDGVLHSTLGCRVGGLAGQHRDAVVAPERDRCPVADRNPGDVSGGDGLLVVGVLCPAVLCARPPENPAGVAVMARVRAHNEIDGKTIASCPCCRKGSCRHAGEVLREARNG